MAREIINDEDVGLVSKSKINENFKELYETDASTIDNVQLILQNYLTTSEIAALYSPIIHTHVISDIVDLQNELDNKSDVNHSHGNINSLGEIGSTPNVPLITGLNGIISVGSFGSTAGTFCEGNDTRLSDAREWIADTVSQVEAESGISTTRRAWTSQRVRQAIEAWWEGTTEATSLDMLRPEIVTQPINESVEVGDSFQLTCLGTTIQNTHLTVAYQWQKSEDGLTGWSDVIGETSTNLEFNPALVDHVGFYRCLVPNAFGTEISDVSEVQVDGSMQVLFGVSDRGMAWDLDRIDHMFQSWNGTGAATPVANYGDPVGLLIGRERGGLDALGPELKSTGAPALYGTGPAASYNTVTGVGTVNRTDAINQGTINFTVTVGKRYRFEITNSSGVSLFIRAATQAGATYFFALAGVTTVSVFSATSPTLLITSSAGSVNLTVVSLKELPDDIHLVQSNASRRPIYSRCPKIGIRNIAQYTEEFDNPYWAKINTTIAANSTQAPDLATTADSIVEDTDNDEHYVAASVPNTLNSLHTASVYVKAMPATRTITLRCRGASFINSAEITVNPVNGTINTAAASSGDYSEASGSVTDVGNGWYRISLTFRSNAEATINYRLQIGSPTYLGNGVNGVYVWGAQVELSSSVTNYQRVGNRFNITESGQDSVNYLFFDGIDDCLTSSTTVNFSNSDEMTFSYGVRSQFTASNNISLEIGGGVGQLDNSISVLTNNSSPAYSLSSRGTLTSVATAPSSYPRGTLSLLTGFSKISTDVCVVKVNGVQVATGASDQGTGNFRNDFLHIGSRNQTSNFFNGFLYSGFIINRIIDPIILFDYEKHWVGSRAGVDL